MLELKITSQNDGQRIEKFVRKTLNEAPLSYIYKAFRKKDIKVNGHWVRKDHVLHKGDVVRIYVTDAQLEDFHKPKELKKAEFPYEIIYEDENIFIANKPAGILVYGDEMEKRNTLTEKVRAYLCLKGEYDPSSSSFAPSPAHRLDRNTSGCVIYGKTDAALKALEELFKEREGIKKTYLALCAGSLDGSGLIDKPLKKDSASGMVKVASIEEGAKNALTEWRALEKFGSCTLVECLLLTGRTHQIRVHMASIGHPLIGDAKYGDFALNKAFRARYGVSRQFLHAEKASFGELTGPLAYLSGREFEAALPKDKEEVLKSLRSETGRD